MVKCISKELSAVKANLNLKTESGGKVDRSERQNKLDKIEKAKDKTIKDSYNRSNSLTIKTSNNTK